MKTFAAQIKWLPYNDGGRRKAPTEGARYCPLIRINENKNSAAQEWSIDFICPDFNKTDIINFRFLADSAPEHLINLNSVYEIYEGGRKVADAKICGAEG